MTRDFSNEQWRKQYRIEPPEQRARSLMFRGLRDYLNRFPDHAAGPKAGVLFPDVSDPLAALERLVNPVPEERKAFRQAAKELLQDGFLVHENGCLRIRNFESAQQRAVSKAAERKRKQRAKEKAEPGQSRDLSQGQERDTGRDMSRDMSQAGGVTVTGKRNETNNPLPPLKGDTGQEGHAGHGLQSRAAQWSRDPMAAHFGADPPHEWPEVAEVFAAFAKAHQRKVQPRPPRGAAAMSTDVRAVVEALAAGYSVADLCSACRASVKLSWAERDPDKVSVHSVLSDKNLDQALALSRDMSQAEPSAPDVLWDDLKRKHQSRDADAVDGFARRATGREAELLREMVAARRWASQFADLDTAALKRLLDDGKHGGDRARRFELFRLWRQSEGLLAAS